MCRLQREWAVYSDDWSQGPEQELIGAHKLGQRMAFCEFLENLRTLPHVTADSDCTLPLTVAETAAVQLEDETIETAINACSKFDANASTDEVSIDPFSFCPSTFEAAREVAKNGPQLPAVVATAAEPAVEAKDWGFWFQSAAVEFANEAVAGLKGKEFVVGTGVVLDAMREERAHTLAMQIGPAMDCLRMLSEQIIHKLQTGDSKGEVEVGQFGSCVYRTDIAKSDADLVIVLKAKLHVQRQGLFEPVW